MAAPKPIPQRSIKRRLLRIMRLAAACSIVMAGLAVTLVARGRSEPYILTLIATALGIGLAVLLGTVLMSLKFLGASNGKDAGAGAAPSESDEK